jgi:F-box protein 11
MCGKVDKDPARAGSETAGARSAMTMELLVGYGESIASAVESAEPGWRILIEGGRYEEVIRIDKPLQLIGADPNCEIFAESPSQSFVTIVAPGVVIRHISFRAITTANIIEVSPEGSLLLENCELSGGHENLIIHSMDTTTVRYCLIKGGQNAIRVGPDSQPIIEYTAITEHRESGVVVETGGDATIKECRIYDSDAGLYVFGGAVMLMENSKATIAECQISNGPGILVCPKARVSVSWCHMRGCRESSIRFLRESRGTVKDCEIGDGGSWGIGVSEFADPIIERCHIYGRRAWGIQAGDYLRSGEVPRAGAWPHIVECEIEEASVAIDIRDNSPRITQCDLHHNEVGIMIQNRSLPTISETTIHDNKRAGIRVLEGGLGELWRCNLFNNGNTNIEEHPRARLSVSDCHFD